MKTAELWVGNTASHYKIAVKTQEEVMAMFEYDALIY